MMRFPSTEGLHVNITTLMRPLIVASMAGALSLSAINGAVAAPMPTKVTVQEDVSTTDNMTAALSGPCSKKAGIGSLPAYANTMVHCKGIALAGKAYDSPMPSFNKKTVARSWLVKVSAIGSHPYALGVYDVKPGKGVIKRTYAMSVRRTANKAVEKITTTRPNRKARYLGAASGKPMVSTAGYSRTRLQLAGGPPMFQGKNSRSLPGAKWTDGYQGIVIISIGALPRGCNVIGAVLVTRGDGSQYVSRAVLKTSNSSYSWGIGGSNSHPKMATELSAATRCR
jgi:hypothetical protein